MALLSRAPYNREVIIWDRWRVRYAPAYGWGPRLRDVVAAAAGRTPSTTGEQWPSDDEVERLDHEAIANHVWRIREAGHMVLAGIDWERPTGITESVPINRLADLKAALDRWDADMGRQPAEAESIPNPHDCCGDVLFWCPSTQSVECGIHGGFARCCDMPELHRSIPALVEGAVMGDDDRVTLEAVASGFVIDAGGGQVGIMVDRDTTDYPVVGSRIVLYLVVPPPIMCTTGDHPDEPAVGDAWGGDEDRPDQRAPYCAECLDSLGEDFGARRWA